MRGHCVTVYDRSPSVGRKLLMAGRGGLNLTHSEPFASFMGRYAQGAERLKPLIDRFGPAALRAWADGLEQQTFVGSSGRVFPRALKASPLLRAWLERLAALGVTIVLRANWTGWDSAGALLFETPAGPQAVQPEATLLALGGASWPRLGADGSWQTLLAARGVDVAPLSASNCGFMVAWSPEFKERFAGQPVKTIGLACGDARVRGEVMITAAGIEGGGVYALSAPLRVALADGGTAQLVLDLKPDLSAATLATRLAAARRQESQANRLRKAARLSPVAIGLLREAGPPPASAEALAARIKALPVTLTGTTGLERAISSAGGIEWEAIDDRMMLRALPGVFVAGEMLDWDAPTGGYLLQACFATGYAAAGGIADWLEVQG